MKISHHVYILYLKEAFFFSNCPIKLLAFCSIQINPWYILSYFAIHIPLQQNLSANLLILETTLVFQVLVKGIESLENA